MGHGTSKTRRSAPCWAGILLAGVALVAVPALLQAQPPVAVSVDLSGNEMPGATLTATAVVEINDGSSVTGYHWSLVGDAPAQLQGGTGGQSVQVKLGPAFEFRFHLHDLLHEPPIEPEDLPPDIDFGEHEFHGGLTDRFQVVGLNHFMLEEAALVVLEVEVTTTSGTYHGEAEIHTSLPWKPTSGILNVPVDIPVLLHGKHQDGYDWSMTPPAGSSASLGGPSSVVPVFTPDIPGIYEVMVTDQASGEPVTMTIYAGTWRGIIAGQDEDGRPVVDAICTTCHSGGPIPDLFTPWMETGHAEIFTDNLNTSTHYGERCFDCHTVGFDPSAQNNGIDEASDYQAFLNAGLLNNPGDNWTTVLEQFPMTAKKANIQCENCHGPNSSEPGLDTLAHGWIPTVEGEPRVSISSDVCARCHGEPLRHARFQQWQLSPHANYDLAISRGTSGSCGRCHAGNGFLEWLPVLTGEKEGDPTASIEVTYTSDEVHPQTCVTCHDPHAVGTTSGAENDAQMRIEGNTPPLLAGFQAFGVGRGAICITCHNSRRGLKHDGNFDEVFGTSDADRAPHAGSQADVLMGENAYMVNTGIRGAHSLIEDSCTQCHMEETAPPDILSYNLGGTNHTFRASPTVCANCHEGLTATGIQAAVEAMSEHLKGLIEDELLDLIVAQLDQGYTIDLDGERTITDAAAIEEVVFTEFHGRQGMAVVFANDTTFGPYTMHDIIVQRPAPMGDVDIFAVADPVLIKAGWNYFLIHNDGSGGVHNPSFVLSILDSTRDALGDFGGPRLMHYPELMALGIDLQE